MAISAAQITVTTTQTLLTVGRDKDGNPGRSVVVHNPGPANVYLGGEDVVAEETGFLLGAGADFAIDLRAGDLLYGHVDSGTQAVHVLQVGV